MVDLLANTLKEFSHQIGVEETHFKTGQTASFQFTEKGTLFVERIGDQMLVYLMRPIERIRKDHLIKALQLSHHTNHRPFFVRVSLRHKNQIVAMIKMHKNDFDLIAFEKIIKTLNAFHDQILL